MSDEDLESTYFGFMRDALALYHSRYPEEFSAVTFAVDSEKAIDYMLGAALCCAAEQEFVLARHVFDTLRHFNSKNSIMPEGELESRIRKINLKVVVGMLRKVREEYRLGNTDIVNHDVPVILKYNELYGVIDEGNLLQKLARIKKNYSNPSKDNNQS